MRIDHVAYRVPNKQKTILSLLSTGMYEIAEHFTIDFDDGSQCNCTALKPIENDLYTFMSGSAEIFVSQGEPGSIVHDWVKNKNGGLGGIHHIAYEVPNVEELMAAWTENHLAEFTTEKPIECEDLIQCFTKPLDWAGGIIFEFIQKKNNKGFCRDSVKELMESTRLDNDGQ